MSRDEQRAPDAEWRAMLDGGSVMSASANFNGAPNVVVSSATPPVPASPPAYNTPPATPPSVDAADPLDSAGRTPTVADANAKLNRARTKSSQSQSQPANLNPDRFDNLTEYMRHLRAAERKAADCADAEMDSDVEGSMWSSQSVRGSPAPVARRTFAELDSLGGSSVELELPEETETDTETATRMSAPGPFEFDIASADAEASKAPATAMEEEVMALEWVSPDRLGETERNH